jgi:hypothetical protein
MDGESSLVPIPEGKRIRHTSFSLLLQYYCLVQTARSELPKGSVVLNIFCSIIESRYKSALTLGEGTLGIAGSVRKHFSL